MTARPPRALAKLSDWARRLDRQLATLHSAARDPRVPWAPRLLALAVLAYALSPIDLIPDFIPVLGLLDDLVLVPLGLALAIRLIPDGIWAEHRAAVRERPPSSRTGMVVVIALWLLALLAVIWLVLFNRVVEG